MRVMVVELGIRHINYNLIKLEPVIHKYPFQFTSSISSNKNEKANDNSE